VGYKEAKRNTTHNKPSIHFFIRVLIVHKTGLYQNNHSCKSTQKLLLYDHMKHTNTSYAPLYQLFFGGIVLILLLLVINQYMKTATTEPTVILPGGQTYVGKNYE